MATLFRAVFLFFLYVNCLYGRHYGKYLVVDICNNPNCGLFASVNYVFANLYLYEQGKWPELKGLIVDFKECGLYYDPQRGPNWWNYYFEPISLGKLKGSKPRVLRKKDAARAFAIRRTLTRLQVAAFVKKYIRIRPWIQEKIDQFVDCYFRDFFVIGIHYRGTAKKSEAPRVEFEKVFEVISENIPSQQPYQIFVATDEELFLAQISEKFPGKVIAIDAKRTVGEEGVHFLHKNSYEVGESAVIDACLLSRCNLLIRTSSNLSLWSTYFNPDLPVILLNQRHCKTLEPE